MQSQNLSKMIAMDINGVDEVKLIIIVNITLLQNIFKFYDYVRN